MKIVIELANFLLKRNSEMARMKHLETQEIISGIYVLKTKGSNFYVIKNDAEYIAIDAGGGNKKIAKAELSKLAIEPEKITTVLLTHTDFDHISALDLFKNATIYISNQEVQMVDGSTIRMFGFGNKLKYDYKTLQNNEELYFGKRKVKCILTPGHTNGSMSYLIDDKYLFVGDTLSLKNGQVELFNSLFNMDDIAQTKSIEKLAKILTADYIFTCHYGFTDDCRKAFHNFNEN